MVTRGRANREAPIAFVGGSAFNPQRNWERGVDPSCFFQRDARALADGAPGGWGLSVVPEGSIADELAVKPTVVRVIDLLGHLTVKHGTNGDAWPGKIEAKLNRDLKDQREEHYHIGAWLFGMTEDVVVDGAWGTLVVDPTPEAAAKKHAKSVRGV
jgi:hypothetical protein